MYNIHFVGCVFKQALSSTRIAVIIAVFVGVTGCCFRGGFAANRTGDCRCTVAIIFCRDVLCLSYVFTADIVTIRIASIVKKVFILCFGNCFAAN